MLAESGNSVGVAKVGGLCCADGAGARQGGLDGDCVGLSRVLTKRVEMAAC